LKIFSRKGKVHIECQILAITKSFVPKKKDGWVFNWLKTYRERPDTIFILIEKQSNQIHGVIQLIEDEGMLVMELIELAPFNIGSTKQYDNVAGCLIAFGCRQSLKLQNAYKGYLTFVSKTSLIELYATKYYATQTIGARMYIDPISGEKLINKYLKL
jgi:hypothetical protein